MKSASILLSCLLACLAYQARPAAAELRVGIIGCDTSHSVAFTEIINKPGNSGDLAGAKVVAAYRGGSPDIPSSASRVEGYAKTLHEKFGVTFYDSIEELCRNVDCVLLESVDGRPHLQQVRPVIAAKKPVFIDKPMAASLKDVLTIFKLAADAKVPVFTASALRFGKDTQAVRNGSIGKVQSAETSSPCEVEPHHPELFWYGVHGVESLYTVMGPGCISVKRGTNAVGKIEVSGTWKEGRSGVFTEDNNYHGTAKGENGSAPIGSFSGYEPLVVEIVKFFKTGVAPVRPEETIELFAFMQAADESKKQNGAAVGVQETLRKARELAGPKKRVLR